VKYLGHTFEHFQKSEPKVSYLAGEFYWQVRLGDRANCDDYVSPPLILSSEKTGNEITWSFGEYVPGPDLWKAFNLKDKPPKPVGVAPNQPSPHTGKVGFLWKAFLVFFAIGVVAQMTLSGFNDAHTHTPVKFAVSSGERAQVTSPPFKIGGLLDGPVTVRTTSNVNDTWLNVDLQLTEVSTGRAYGIKRALGFTKVGGQVDGTPVDVAELNAVPPGRYTLAIDARTGALPSGSSTGYSGAVDVYRSPLGWSNFWFFVVAIAFWPFIAWRRARNFENYRWSESDYADASSGDGGGSGSDDD
jgi:hypothetical protein